jgi:hypothetical protein
MLLIGFELNLFSLSLLFPGTYGTQGVGTTSTTPGARYTWCPQWIDSNDNLWLYGGADSITGGTLSFVVCCFEVEIAQ